MPRLVELSDRELIERLLRRNPALNIYQIGDLDDFFWAHTRWFTLQNKELELTPALVYSPADKPTLLLLIDRFDSDYAALLAGLVEVIPEGAYGHLSEPLLEVTARFFEIRNHGRHLKMTLSEPGLAWATPTTAGPLSERDGEELLQLYQEAYPNNWFDARMLATGAYFGVRRDGRLVAAGGVHVYSPRYRVAALGNITTHPEWRGRGLAGDVTAAICKHLRVNVDLIGLNVKDDNVAAISCYRKLGFAVAATYTEVALVGRSQRQ